MSADESARDARETSTAPRLLLLGVLVDAAEACDTLLPATLATAATRIGAVAAGLLVAAAAAVDCAATRAMAGLQGTRETRYAGCDRYCCGSEISFWDQGAAETSRKAQ
jgi:hypothetical protein